MHSTLSPLREKKGNNFIPNNQSGVTLPKYNGNINEIIFQSKIQNKEEYDDRRHKC